MAKISGVINMKDIDEFMEYCNRLDRQGLINMIEGMYTQDIMNQMEIDRLEKALDLACEVLDLADGILFNLYDRYLDTYYDTKDKQEWKNYLLESVIDNE